VDGSFVGLLGRLIVSMGVVMAVMWMAAKVVKGRNLGGFGGLTGNRRNGPKPKIEVLARQAFGKGASIAIVRAGGKDLVVGVTDQRVTVLAEADAKALADIDTESFEPEGQGTAAGGGVRPGQPWRTMLEQLRERTVRR
jgi:flagellar protein FliO/FliZ